VQRLGCKPGNPRSGFGSLAAQAHFAQRSEGPQGRTEATKPQRCVQRLGCKPGNPRSGFGCLAAQAHFAQRSEGPQGRTEATKPQRCVQRPGCRARYVKCSVGA